MRRVAPLIALSLLGNAALGVVLWQKRTTSAGAPGRDTTPIHAPSSATESLADISKTWQLVSQNADETTLIAFLRDSGFPPDVVRSLVTERVSERYRDRFRELSARIPETPYWRSNWYDYNNDIAVRTERRAIHKEIQAAVNQLLGEKDQETQLSDYDRQNRQRKYGDLSSDKVTELEAISRDYDEIAEQVRANTKDVILPEDREKLAFLEKEKRADLASILTPEELNAYDRRNSPSAAEIRGKLTFFDASEEEYIKLYQAQRDFDARYGRDNLSGEQNERRKKALPELAAQLKEALGPERYAEYEIITDSNYRDTRYLLGSIGLEPEAARELVVLHRATNRRASAIKADQSLTPEQRTAQLTALEKEATEKVVTTIGADNLPHYQKNYTGGWLKKITQPAKAPTSR